MKYLHTMVRIKNIEESLSFYCDALGLVVTRRSDYEKGRFTLIFLASPDDLDAANATASPLIELTYNWDPEEYTCGRNFGHLAFRVSNIYETCTTLMKKGVTLNRPPRDGRLAFIKSPDNISIELLQEGQPLEVQEPWVSMPNIGTW